MAWTRSVIIDLGSNIGASIAFFHATYPDARIVGLEPDPETFRRLLGSVAPIPQVQVLPLAVSDHIGDASFRPDTQSWASALGDGAGSITVRTITLPDLLAAVGVESVDLLKLDVEGAEWLMFDSHGSFDACGTIVGELHLDAADQTVTRAEEALTAFAVTVTVACRRASTSWRRGATIGSGFAPHTADGDPPVSAGVTGPARSERRARPAVPPRTVCRRLHADGCWTPPSMGSSMQRRRQRVAVCWLGARARTVPRRRRTPRSAASEGPAARVCLTGMTGRRPSSPPHATSRRDGMRPGGLDTYIWAPAAQAAVRQQEGEPRGRHRTERGQVAVSRRSKCITMRSPLPCSTSTRVASRLMIASPRPRPRLSNRGLSPGPVSATLTCSSSASTVAST